MRKGLLAVRVAVVAGSLLLAGGYVCFRAGVLRPPGVRPAGPAEVASSPADIPEAPTTGASLFHEAFSLNPRLYPAPDPPAAQAEVPVIPVMMASSKVGLVTWQWPRPSSNELPPFQLVQLPGVQSAVVLKAENARMLSGPGGMLRPAAPQGLSLSEVLAPPARPTTRPAGTAPGG